MPAVWIRKRITGEEYRIRLGAHGQKCRQAVYDEFVVAPEVDDNARFNHQSRFRWDPDLPDDIVRAVVPGPRAPLVAPDIDRSGGQRKQHDRHDKKSKQGPDLVPPLKYVYFSKGDADFPWNTSLIIPMVT